MLPCSVSMQIQSKPHLAMVLDRCVPGSICHAPNDSPLPVCSAWRRVFAFFIICAISAHSFAERFLRDFCCAARS